jgi:hypothetical protein
MFVSTTKMYPIKKNYLACRSVKFSFWIAEMAMLELVGLGVYQIFYTSKCLPKSVSLPTTFIHLKNSVSLKVS